MACDDALTLSEMRTRVFRMLGEDPDNPVYWTSAEVGRYVNDAYVEAARETKALEYVEAIALTSGSEAGTLSDYVGQIFRVTWDDNKIRNATKWELDRTEFDWENLTGEITHYVTTLQDNRTISTYKAWDGTTYNSWGPWQSGAYTYSAWADATAYDVGDRVTVTTSDITFAYYCIDDHTSDEANDKPGSGTNWTTYWTPLALMVWATKHPAVLTDNDECELPQWSHLGVCYRAAAKALRKYFEHRNESLAEVYDALATDYLKLLRGHVANRTPEKTVTMGPTIRPARRPQAEQTVSE